jgi:hypothetical protein
MLLSTKSVIPHLRIIYCSCWRIRHGTVRKFYSLCVTYITAHLWSHIACRFNFNTAFCRHIALWHNISFYDTTYRSMTQHIALWHNISFYDTTTTIFTHLLLSVLNCFALKSPIYVGSVPTVARRSLRACRQQVWRWHPNIYSPATVNFKMNVT